MRVSYSLGFIIFTHMCIARREILPLFTFTGFSDEVFKASSTTSRLELKSLTFSSDATQTDKWLGVRSIFTSSLKMPFHFYVFIEQVLYFSFEFGFSIAVVLEDEVSF